jgi:hypothetical protein
MTGVLILHSLATLMMTGVIWFVQLVHYPLFRLVGVQGATVYEHEHMRRTTWLVAPLMLTEAATACMLAVFATAGAAKTLSYGGILLLAIVWGSTWLMQVPCHNRLAERFDGNLVRRLVLTNWVRTLAWSARSGIALLLPVVWQT